jgi:alkylation response protein AidB-like acyl-CoA dehydrogenase
MNFDRSEEQRLLAASIERFVARDYGFDARRRIVASAEGYSRDVWRTFADLGLLGLAIPNELGGLSGRASDLAVVMETFGSALIVEPFLSTVLGARLIARTGSAAQKAALLPKIAAGDLIVAFAHTENNARYDLASVATTARETSDGFVLAGDKRVVLHAPCAQVLIVSAKTSRDGDIGLFVVKADAAGIAMARYRTLDALRAADVVLTNVHVDVRARLDAPDALPAIEEAIDYATALVCAEAIGAIGYANDATLEYLKTRQQFGVPIGSFQALQHRMVDMAIEHEQAKSMAQLACATVDSDVAPAERKRVVSAAKIRMADACRRVSQESIQLHGGMGMSDELKVSHTFRRLTMIAQQFGDVDHHLERFASQ